jgi:hypothetical protein
MSASASGMAPLCSTRCWRLVICSFPSTYGKPPYAVLCGRRPGLPYELPSTTSGPHSTTRSTGQMYPPAAQRSSGASLYSLTA